jgi:hypothetical protein
MFIDKGFDPIHFAIQELRVLIGEPDSPLSIEWIRDYSFCKDAKFLNTNGANVFYEYVNLENKQKEIAPIEAKTIIDFEGLCLVEEIGYEDEWLMGQIDDKERILCWGNYGTLKEAIMGL